MKMWFFPEEAKKSWTRIVVEVAPDGRKVNLRGSLMNSSVAIKAVDIQAVHDGAWIRVQTKFAWPGAQGEFQRSFDLTPAFKAIYFGEEREAVWHRP